MCETEFCKFFSWKVNPISAKIFLDVPQDIDKLQKETHLNSVTPCIRIRVAINFDQAKSDCGGDAITVTAQIFEAGVRGFEQVIFHPVDQFTKMLDVDGVPS